jgi:hypothetical protein
MELVILGNKYIYYDYYYDYYWLNFVNYAAVPFAFLEVSHADTLSFTFFNIPLICPV